MNSFYAQYRTIMPTDPVYATNRCPKIIVPAWDHGPRRCVLPTSSVGAVPPAPRFAVGNTPNRPYVFWSTLT